MQRSQHSTFGTATCMLHCIICTNSLVDGVVALWFWCLNLACLLQTWNLHLRSGWDALHTLLRAVRRSLSINSHTYTACCKHDRPLISIHGRSCQSDMWLQHTLYAARSQPDNSALPVTDGVIVDDTLSAIYRWAVHCRTSVVIVCRIQLHGKLRVLNHVD